MKRNKLLPFCWLFLIALLVYFSSCVSVSKFVKKADKNPATVPAGFNPSKHILLFADMPRLKNPNERNDHVTKKLEQALKEYCPYKYEIVSLKEIQEMKGKYSDTSVYKYAILNSLNSIQHSTTTTTTRTTSSGTYTSSVSPSAKTTYIRFRFF